MATNIRSWMVTGRNTSAVHKRLPAEGNKTMLIMQAKAVVPKYSAPVPASLQSKYTSATHGLP